MASHPRGGKRLPTRSFVALYRDERLVAVSGEPGIVRKFIHELTGEGEESEPEEQDGLVERVPLRLVPGGDEN